jgi:hypothetical protein
MEVTDLGSGEKYRADGKKVETQRFRVQDQGSQSFEFDMCSGVVVDEPAMVSSLDELTEIFEGALMVPPASEFRLPSAPQQHAGGDRRGGFAHPLLRI